jgi:hypothetical protein
MPGERQRRTLDAPAQQSAAEIVVKTPQAIKVDGVLINPHGLHDFLLAGGAMARKESLVQECELIVRPRLTVGRATG